MQKAVEEDNKLTNICPYCQTDISDVDYMTIITDPRTRFEYYAICPHCLDGERKHIPTNKQEY